MDPSWWMVAPGLAMSAVRATEIFATRLQRASGKYRLLKYTSDAVRQVNSICCDLLGN
jgi:hypothetical protein